MDVSQYYTSVSPLSVVINSTHKLIASYLATATPKPESALNTHLRSPMQVFWVTSLASRWPQQPHKAGI